MPPARTSRARSRPDLASGGGSQAFIIPVTPTASATTGNNTAYVTGGGDPACAGATDCPGSVSVDLNAPQLTITKSASPNPFVVGQAASYTITVTNNGTAPTTATATVTDAIPTGLTIGTLPAGCSAAGQNVTCTIAAGSRHRVAVQAFTIPVTPTASATTGDNTAYVTAAAIQPVLARPTVRAA